MSTVPTPTPSPDPATMPLNDLRAQITTPPAPTAPEPTPAAPAPAISPAPFEIVEGQGTVEIKLSTGQVYKGTDIKDATAKLAAAQLEASRTISELRKAPPAQEPTPAPAPTPTGFNTQAVAEKYSSVDLSKLSSQDFNALYYAALAADPAEAAALSNARSMGFKNPGEFYQFTGQMQQTTEQTMMRDLVVSFASVAPDFPFTQEAGNALGDIMEEAGVTSPTVKNMKMAWAYAKSEGKIKPLTAEEIQAQRMGQFSQPKPPTPPPTIPSNPPDLAAQDTNMNLQTMPLNDLRNMILRAQQNK